ncbi:hypothetical protein DB88DRAFT_92639 [Papiliotrema laurentii]|uniref:Uncharacterized protein n=1 Tax=Papiliotrema laurentii TaxID=5418 RepID=A0AAD9CV62_PAPLA|nr:hypothetical protein DB88DRAFT_92639 [Papiliotrema laurentii]
MSFLPRLFRSTPSFAPSASFGLPALPSTATAGPSRIRMFSTTPVVEKMRTVQAAVFRFKYKKSTNEVCGDFHDLFSPGYRYSLASMLSVLSYSISRYPSRSVLTRQWLRVRPCSDSLSRVQQEIYTDPQRQAGVRHGNTMWSVGHLKRLRGPVAIKTKNQKKTIQRMLPYGN